MVYVFYFSASGLISKVAVDAMMWRVMQSDDTTDWSSMTCIRNETVSQQMDCVKAGVSKAMWMLTIDKETGIDCYVPYRSGISMAGVFHFGSLACVAFFLLMALSLFAASGSSNFRSGEYLVFTWLLESRYRWQMGVQCLILATVVMILGAFTISAGVIPGLQMNLSPGQLFKLAWTDMLMLIFSSLSMKNVYTPPFDWLDPDVAATTYSRNWIDLIQQTNDSFGQQLANTILRARLGNETDLTHLAPGLDAAHQDISSAVYSGAITDSSNLLDPTERLQYVQLHEVKPSAIGEDDDKKFRSSVEQHQNESLPDSPQEKRRNQPDGAEKV